VPREKKVSGSLTLSPSERARLVAALREFKSRGNRFHVISSRDAWAVISEDRPKWREVFGDKNEATERGRSLARESGGDLVIHGRDGDVLARESFGRRAES
jgi:hypothetical protein